MPFGAPSITVIQASVLLMHNQGGLCLIATTALSGFDQDMLVIGAPKQGDRSVNALKRNC